MTNAAHDRAFTGEDKANTAWHFLRGLAVQVDEEAERASDARGHDTFTVLNDLSREMGRALNRLVR